MLPSATDRKREKSGRVFIFVYFYFFKNALNIKKLTVFGGKCKNTNK